MSRYLVSYHVEVEVETDDRGYADELGRATLTVDDLYCAYIEEI